jgi:hypothetical protein
MSFLLHLPPPQELVNKTWVKRNWKGPVQYEDKETRKLMMLPTDMVGHHHHHHHYIIINNNID